MRHCCLLACLWHMYVHGRVHIYACYAYVEGRKDDLRQYVLCGHLCNEAVCAVRPATCAMCLPVQYGYLCSMATCAIWPPAQYGLLRNTATCAIWPHVQYGHLCNMATCAIWPQVEDERPTCSGADAAEQVRMHARTHARVHARTYVRAHTLIRIGGRARE